MKRAYLFLLVFILTNSLKAQETEVPVGEFWLGLQFAVPVGVFADKIERNLGYGGNLGGVWNPSKVSNFFQVGLDIGVNYMGKDKQEIGGVPMKTTNTLITTHLVTRFRVQTTSPVKPYVDLLGGGKFISTTTKYDNNLFETVFDIEDQSVFADQTNGVWSYGIGMGFSFRRQRFGADFRILYLASGPMDFVSPKNLMQDENGDFFYEHTEVSRTHMVFPQIGISLDL